MPVSIEELLESPYANVDRSARNTRKAHVTIGLATIVAVVMLVVYLVFLKTVVEPYIATFIHAILTPQPHTSR